MSNDGWKAAAAAEIREKIDAELKLIETLAEQERMLRASSAEASKRIIALHTGAQALGIVLDDQPVPDAEFKGAAPLAGAASAREIVLDELRANPGMKSAELKMAIERRMGRKIHYKTPGMTLYRLAQEGLVERLGHQWFFKPEQEALSKELELLLK